MDVVLILRAPNVRYFLFFHFFFFWNISADGETAFFPKSDMTGYSQSCQAETDHLVCLDTSSDLVVVSSETLVIKWVYTGQGFPHTSVAWGRRWSQKSTKIDFACLYYKNTLRWCRVFTPVSFCCQNSIIRLS